MMLRGTKFEEEVLRVLLVAFMVQCSMWVLFFLDFRSVEPTSNPAASPPA